MAAFESAAPLLASLADRYPRLQIAISTPAALQARVASRFPQAVIYPLPANNRFAIARYINRTKIRLVLVLEDADLLSSSLLAGLRRAGVGVIAVSAQENGQPASSRIAHAAEVTMHLASQGQPGGIALDDAVGVLGALLGRDLKARRQEVAGPNGIAALLLRATAHPLRRRLLGWRLARIGDLAALAGELGRPGTIMCLGNGPSSEDALLATMARDALFRVNHSWLERGYLTEADVVFTGGSRTMLAVPKAIFGVQTREAEERIAALRTFRPGLGRTLFFRAADLAPGLDRFPWGSFRPTNGAAMLAVAVALQPDRLIVAGIDLFQHPEGSYPGDRLAPNAYIPAHDRMAEQRFLMGLFDSYRGDLVIVGEVLRRAWQEWKTGNESPVPLREQAGPA